MCSRPLGSPTGSPAADFVAQRYSQIVKYGSRFFRSLPEERKQDAIQELLRYCLEKHDGLRLDDARNPEAVISNWLYFQCAAVRKLAFSQVKQEDKVTNVAMLYYTGENAYSTIRVADAAAAELVDRLYGMATEDERSAMIAMELELSAGEARKMKMPVEKQKQLLRNLGRRAESAGISMICDSLGRA